MKYLALCILAVVFGTSSAQQHGGGQDHGHSGSLHAICHSNHQQLTEDQVIQQVVSAMNTDPDGTVESTEALVFFAELMGISGSSMRCQMLSPISLMKFAMHHRFSRPPIELWGHCDLGSTVNLLGNITTQELLQLAAGLSIKKHDLVQAWHQKFHDSVEFIGATFDVFDTNNDGVLDAQEIEEIVNVALARGDANGDGKLQEAELVTFLERIYKNC